MNTRTALDSPYGCWEVLFASISATKDAIEIFLILAISFNPSQKGFSREIDVACPLIVSDRFIIIKVLSYSLFNKYLRKFIYSFYFNDQNSSLHVLLAIS